MESNQRYRYSDEDYLNHRDSFSLERVKEYLEKRWIRPESLIIFRKTMVMNDGTLGSVTDEMHRVKEIMQSGRENEVIVAERVDFFLNPTGKIIEFKISRTKRTVRKVKDGEVHTSIVWADDIFVENMHPLSADLRLEIYKATLDRYSKIESVTLNGICCSMECVLENMRKAEKITTDQQTLYSSYYHFYLWPEMLEIMPAGIRHGGYWWKERDFESRIKAIEKMILLCSDMMGSDADESVETNEGGN